MLVYQRVNGWFWAMNQSPLFCWPILTILEPYMISWNHSHNEIPGPPEFSQLHVCHPQGPARRHGQSHCFGSRIYLGLLVGGIPTPLGKYEFVSWDDDIPNILGQIKNVPKFQATNQIVSTGGPKRRFHKMGNTDLEGSTEPCLAVDAWPDPSAWLNYMLLRTPKWINVGRSPLLHWQR